MLTHALKPLRTSADVPAPNQKGKTGQFLGSAVSLVGGVCGAYVGVRGSRLWVVLGLSCAAVYGINLVLDYVVGGLWL